MSEGIILGPVKAWSMRRLTDFEACPLRLYLNAVERKPGPPRGEDNPMVRGIRIHKLAEDFVKGEIEHLPSELKRFKDDFELLKEEYSAGRVSLEGDWGFDINWQPCGYYSDEVWGRMKLDACHTVDKKTARVIDYKSGKKFGNEVKHTGQAQCYMIGTFMRHPEIDLLTTEFWYTDEGTTLKKQYSRDKLPVYLKRFTDRVMKVVTATSFPPKPNRSNCKFCDYGLENGTGECTYSTIL